jgi:hypothetical protein
VKEISKAATKILRHKKVRKPLGIGAFGQNLAEKEGFEPSCRSPDKCFSRAPRYGHFGTSPYCLYMQSICISIYLMCRNVL